MATPLIVPADEFRRSLDAFPLEYGEIVRAHARVFGDDPFDGIPLAPEDLRRACETQVKGHLLHLREEFIEWARALLDSGYPPQMSPYAIGLGILMWATAFTASYVMYRYNRVIDAILLLGSDRGPRRPPAEPSSDDPPRRAHPGLRLR